MSRSNALLLVEDNPDDEALTLRALRRSGVSLDVEVARDGAEALARLTERRTLPALVLLDLKLPKIDGLEVLRRLREHDATALLTVVILTTSREERDIADAYGLGANSYIRKPVEFAEFAESLRHITRYWLHINEPPPVVAA